MSCTLLILAMFLIARWLENSAETLFIQRLRQIFEFVTAHWFLISQQVYDWIFIVLTVFWGSMITNDFFQLAHFGNG